MSGYSMKQYMVDARKTLPKGTYNGDELEFQAIKRQLDLSAFRLNKLDAIKKFFAYGVPGDGSYQVRKPSVPECPLGEVLDAMNIDPDLFHAILGIATETAELIESLQTSFVTGEIDKVNLVEELGDLLWYQSIAMKSLGTTFEEVAKVNIEKLKSRYPDKFTSEKAANRDTDAERSVLEKSIKDIS